MVERSNEMLACGRKSRSPTKNNYRELATYLQQVITKQSCKDVIHACVQSKSHHKVSESDETKVKLMVLTLARS